MPGEIRGAGAHGAFCVRQGYFFTLDAFIAGSIIAAGLLIVLLYRANVPQQEQTVTLAEDMMQYLSSVQVRSINNPYIDSLRKQKQVDTEHTIMEQLGEYYYKGQIQEAAVFADNATAGSIPEQYGYMILINGTTIISKNKPFTAVNSTSFLFSSRKVIFGTAGPGTMWVYKAEVRVWQG